MDTIEVGYWIAVTLKKDTAPLRCFVGQVKAVDQLGIRVALRLEERLISSVDRVDFHKTNYELFHGYDVFIPWSNLDSALIANSDRMLSGFSPAANKWQDSMVKGLKYDELQER
jgi:hypothetical protein